jgi:hypothetical protein
MKYDGSKIVCETPTPGKESTRIDKWKYYAIRRVILDLLAEQKKGVLFKDLAKMVSKKIRDKETRQNLGSIPWYTTTVKLDLEVKEEIEQVPGKEPQILRMTK